MQFESIFIDLSHIKILTIFCKYFSNICNSLSSPA